MRDDGESGLLRTVTYSQALNEALREEMRRDENVFVMGEDVAVWGDGGGVFGVTKGLVDEFGPARVRDTPISEEAIVAIGVGAAVAGVRPVVELMYFDFVTLAMEPIVNQAAKLRYMFGGQASVPLVIRSNIGASGGKAAQHSQSLESWLVHVPGLKVVVPSTPYDAKGLLKTAIRDDDPVVFLEHKLLYFTKGELPDGDYTVAFGQAAVRRRGTDATVVATHEMSLRALQAAEQLASEGIELEVVDPRTLVPLDIATIAESVARTHRLVICHEAVERGGWAAEVAMQVSEHVFDELDAPIVRICGANVPVPYSAALEDLVIPGVEDIVAGVRRVLGDAGPTAGAATSAAVRPARPTAADGGPTDGRVQVILSRFSDTMVEGIVGRWLRTPGTRVEKGEDLVEVETDKVTVLVPATDDGILTELVEEGATVPVGGVLAVILTGSVSGDRSTTRTSSSR